MDRAVFFRTSSCMGAGWTWTTIGHKSHLAKLLYDTVVAIMHSQDELHGHCMLIPVVARNRQSFTALGDCEANGEPRHDLFNCLIPQHQTTRPRDHLLHLYYHNQWPHETWWHPGTHSCCRPDLGLRYALRRNHLPVLCLINKQFAIMQTETTAKSRKLHSSVSVRSHFTNSNARCASNGINQMQCWK